MNEDLKQLKPVGTSINVSYMYLNLESQRCGRLLANLPGSFGRETAHSIMSINIQFLNALVESSLLEYDKDAHCFIFHRLIRLFFVYVQELMGSTGTDEVKGFKAQFFHHDYLDNLTCLSAMSELLHFSKELGSE